MLEFLATVVIITALRDVMPCSLVNIKSIGFISVLEDKGVLKFISEDGGFRFL
jgi:hypothetical protein